MKKLIILLNSLLLLVACNSNKANEQSTPEILNGNSITLTDAQYKNAGIATGQLETRTISSVLKLNGKIDVPPQSLISISVPLGGYLKSTKLLPGMHVVKGEVLAVLEDPQYIELQQEYLTAKAQFAFDEAEYNRQKELNQSKASSDKVFEQVKATYQSHFVLIKALEQKLRLIGLNPDKLTANSISRSISIHSPINGFVSAVNVNIGKYVTPSDVLFELVDPTDIHLALTVFDKDISKLAIGQKLFAFTNTHPEQKHEGEIILISKNLSNDNSVQVHCHFEKYDKTLLPGMFMNATIELLENDVTALPDDAIVRYENKHYAYIVNGSHQFEMQEVQIGDSENGFTEILNAEQFKGKTFVVKGAYHLLMAMKNINEE